MGGVCVSGAGVRVTGMTVAVTWLPSIEIQEAKKRLFHYVETISLNDERLALLNEQLEKIHHLARKHQIKTCDLLVLKMQLEIHKYGSSIIEVLNTDANLDYQTIYRISNGIVSQKSYYMDQVYNSIGKDKFNDILDSLSNIPISSFTLKFYVLY